MLSAFLLMTAFRSESPKTLISDIVVNRLNYENEMVLAEVTVRLGATCQELKKIAYRYDRDRNAVLLYPEIRNLEAKTTCLTEAGQNETVTQWIPLGRFAEGQYEIRDLKSLRVLESFEIAKGPSMQQEMITLLKR